MLSKSNISQKVDDRQFRGESSFGCELQPSLFGFAQEIVASGLVDHFQVTIPNTVSYRQIHAANLGLPVIAHSNLLNIFGDNDWVQLKQVAVQIRSLNPVHVVEHFTALRLSDGTKSGVCFPRSDSEMNRAIDNIHRWQDILGLRLCIENVPITKDIRRYFDSILFAKEATSCEFACDMPHFFLSIFTAILQGELPESALQAYADQLLPTQLHVGGLTHSDQGVRDNHKLFSPWICDQAKVLFPNPKYVTLEQNHRIPWSVVRRNLVEMRKDRCEEVPSIIRDSPGICEQTLNQELAREAAMGLGLTVAVRRPSSFQSNGPVGDSAVDLYNRYLPFVYPLESIEAEMSALSDEKALQVIAGFSRWSLSYLSWWYPDFEGYARVSYGDRSGLKYSGIVGSRKSFDTKGFGDERKIRFSSERGFWVEVATPIIVLADKATYPTGATYDTGAI